jgi:acyl-CoA synthetase (AMP-forming)/AMP-acid ligase II
VYTGGTTGMPKGVLWRQRDLLVGPLRLRRRDGSAFDSLGEIAAAAAHRTDLRALPAPPLMHGAGSWFALSTWLAGATVVFPDVVDRLDAEGLFRICEAERVTAMIIVGDAFAVPLIEALRSGSYDLSVRRIINTGASLRHQLRAEFCARIPGLILEDTLGSSETGPQVARRGSRAGAFTPTPGSPVEVLSADRGRCLSPGDGELGWLASAGPVPLGYLGDPAKTAETFPTVDGTRYAVAGDRARIQADGSLEILGREGTTINTGGEKVFAEEVEAILRSVAGVADAIVVGRASERWGEDIVALLQVVPLATVEIADLQGACQAHLARYKHPRKFLFVSQVRRGPNGKADYGWARAIASTPASP